MKLLEIKLQYASPNFDHEWIEAQRYPELANLGKNGWIRLAQFGKKVRLNSLKDVSNMDPDLSGLESDKINRARTAFGNRLIELPIVIRINGENDLLGGNTRIAFLLDQDIDPFIWFIDVDELFDNL